MTTTAAPTLEKIVTMIPPTIVVDTMPKHNRQLRTAAYCRVSTDSDEQELSFDAQVKAYTDKIMRNPEWSLAGIFADATDIIGLKQNPTNGRRFSPIFSFIGHLSERFDEMLLQK